MYIKYRHEFLNEFTLEPRNNFSSSLKFLDILLFQFLLANKDLKCEYLCGLTDYCLLNHGSSCHFLFFFFFKCCN